MMSTFWRTGMRGAAIAAIALAVTSVALAWTGPLSSAPTCASGNTGCDAPLNVSSTAQTKNGQLTVSYGGGGSVTFEGYNNGGGYGVYGYAVPNNGIGVRGDGGSGNYGGYFIGGYGVYGQSNGSGYGLYGYSPSGYAVLASSDSSIGVRGSSGGTWAGYFTGTYGLYGQGNTYGTEGYATSGGYGVYGVQGGNGYGVYGYAPASGGVGVRGDGYAYGLYGYNTATGYYGLVGYSSYTIYGNGNGYLSGSMTASGYYYSSDARLKKDIEPLADSLAKVLKLQPVTYEWKDSSRGAGMQLGFIAQQVQTVVPELVHEDSSTSMLSVDYAKITPLLVGAVQAQQQEIDGLKAQLASQNARLDALEAKLDAR